MAVRQRHSACAVAFIDAGARLVMQQPRVPRDGRSRRRAPARAEEDDAPSGDEHGGCFLDSDGFSDSDSYSDDEDSEEDEGSGSTPLHEAVRLGLPLVVEALAEAGHDMNVKKGLVRAHRHAIAPEVHARAALPEMPSNLPCCAAALSAVDPRPPPADH